MPRQQKQRRQSDAAAPENAAAPSEGDAAQPVPNVDDDAKAADGAEAPAPAVTAPPPPPADDVPQPQQDAQDSAPPSSVAVPLSSSSRSTAPASGQIYPWPRRAVLIPDSENDETVINFDLVDDLWYRDAAEAVRDHGIPIALPAFPDSRRASAAAWIPFAELRIDRETLVIAHGTGAACLQRMLSDGNCTCAGAILVAPFDIDLDDEREIAAGYFAKPLDTEVLLRACPWYVVVASEDDPFVPIDASSRVAAAVGATYYPLNNNSHFVTRHHPELLEVIRQTLAARYGPARSRPLLCGKFVPLLSEVIPVHPDVAAAAAPPPPAAGAPPATTSTSSCMPVSCLVA